MNAPAGSTRVLGLDFGTRRVGASVSDPRRKIATPLEVRDRKDPAQDARHYRKLVAEHDVDLVVIGLPVHASGQEGTSARQARAWGAWFAKETGLPVVYYDERYSSVDAESRMLAAGYTRQGRKERRDAQAAQIMLQNYLDAGCPMPEVETPSAPIDDVP